ncbi:MAG: hypothetical protein QOJ99_5746 [Bryobacterales bacterium]|nr:hypothetical protein [Bryobacterales bacterium]
MLMPDAGQLLHPAHRTSDEVVEVWLGEDKSVSYRDRRLIWVEGRLRRLRTKPTEGLASFALADAVTERASPRDITRWFTP